MKRISTRLSECRACSTEVFHLKDEENAMLSTRTTRGMSLRAYAENFGVDFEKTHEKKLRRLVQLGLIQLEGGFLRLTEKGMELQNAVVVELMDDQP